MIQLSFPHRTADSYEEVCARLLAETKKVDVDLHTCLDDIIEWGEEWPFD